MGLSAPVPMASGWTMAPVYLCPLRHPLQMVCSPLRPSSPGPLVTHSSPLVPDLPPDGSLLQRLGLEPATFSASMVAAASSMHAGSPSAAASPATQATSVSWTSAGNTVATEAPVLPLPPVCPLPEGRLAPCGQPPGCCTASDNAQPLPTRLASASPHAWLHNPSGRSFCSLPSA